MKGRRPVDPAFQSRSAKVGHAWERTVESWLTFHGWAVAGRRVKVDGAISVDIVATDLDGQQWWIECKGSNRNEPGCTRLTTVKVAVGVAYHLLVGGRTTPYALLTSHLPNPGTEADALLRRALDIGAFTWIGVASGDAPAIKVGK